MLQRAVEWERLTSNSARATRKPAVRRHLAVRPIAPADVERLRAVLVEQGRRRDAVLVAVFPYSGVRPQEALELCWRHVRTRTLVIEQAVADGQVRGQKN